MRAIPTLPVATLMGATPATSLPAAPPKRRTANGEERTEGSIDHFPGAYSTADGFVADSVPYLVEGERMASVAIGLAAGNLAAMRYVPERLQTRVGGANGAWNLNLHDRAGENDMVTPSDHILHILPTVVAGIGGGDYGVEVPWQLRCPQGRGRPLRQRRCCAVQGRRAEVGLHTALDLATTSAQP